MAKRTRIKKKEKKNISSGVVHIQSTFNNTIITITDPVGNAIARLLDSPKTGAGGACNILAALPPQEFKAALEKDLQGGLVSTSGYSLALRQTSTDVKKELLQRLFGMQERGGT